MCYKPLNIRVRSKVIDYQISSPLTTSVPCGHCIECNHRKRDEMRFRTYYESLRTIQSGGFILSQCLTYEPKYRPHLSDFMPCDSPVNDCSCFNRGHIRSFLMTLRNYIRRELGINISNKLKYLICSEYGTSDFGQHAPHYHGLFFCTESSLSWKLLSSAIEKCWSFGLTDSIVRYPESYFVNSLKPHIFNSENFNIHTFSIAINYVTEYLTKDCQYQDTLNKRFYAYYDTLCSTLGRDAARQVARQVKRNTNQFRLNSHHFGDNFFDYNTFEDVFSNGVVRMPGITASMPSLTIPLPTYFERSLFYKLIRDFDGTLKWCKKEDFSSHHYFKSKVLRQIDTFANRFESLSLSINDICRSTIDSLLDGRSFHDFAVYTLCYRGRLVTDSLFDPDAQIDSIIKTSRFGGLGSPFVGFVNYDECRPLIVFSTLNSVYYDFTFLKKNTYSQNTFKEFRRFDDLFHLFSDIQAESLVSRQSADRLIQSIQKTSKLLKK